MKRSAVGLSPAIHKRAHDIDLRAPSWQEARALRKSLSASLRRSGGTDSPAAVPQDLAKSGYIPAHLTPEDLRAPTDPFTERQREKFEAWKTEEDKRVQAAKRREGGLISRVIGMMMRPLRKKGASTTAPGAHMAASIVEEGGQESMTDDTTSNVHVRPLLKTYSPRLRTAQRAVERAVYDQFAEQRRQEKLAARRREEEERKQREEEDLALERKRHAFKARPFVGNPEYKYQAPSGTKPLMVPESPKFHETRAERKRRESGSSDGGSAGAPL